MDIRRKKEVEKIMRALVTLLKTQVAVAKALGISKELFGSWYNHRATKGVPYDRYLDMKEKTLQRMAWVRQTLSAHDGNIALLQAFAAGEVSLKNKQYTKGAEHYKPTREDQERLPHTLANLEKQRELLFCELQTLLKYGA